MGRALRAPLGERAPHVGSPYLAAVEGSTAAAHERRQRSLVFNTVFTASAAAVVATVVVLDGVPASSASAVVLPAWLVFQAAALSYRRGARSRTTWWLSRLDTLARIVAVHALIFLSGTLTTPLWALSMLMGFVSSGSFVTTLRLERVALGVAHVCLLLRFLVLGEFGGAFFSVLVASGSAWANIVSARMAAAGLRVEAERDFLIERARAFQVGHERDRMARELHDGVGADIMATVLRLRRVAETTGDTEIRALVGRAEKALASLRQLVATLRPERDD